MTYDASEKGMQSGAPVEIYEFTRGTTEAWRYTSADQDVTVGPYTYTATTLRRTSIEATPEAARSAIRLIVPRDNEVADLYRVAPPTDIIALTVKRYHAGDGNVAVIWMGRVVNAEWSGSQATINCEPVSSSFARPGLRRMYQRACPHVLYSTACGVSKISKKVTGNADGVSGVTVSISECSAYAAGYFAGGFIEWTNSGGNTERRFITDHTGAALTLSLAASGLAVGMEVNVYPGCDHTLSTCKTKFSNLNNYGGFPHIPTKNPFNGDPIY